LLSIDARLIGNRVCSAGCCGIEPFLPDFAVQPHVKVRGYDAYSGNVPPLGASAGSGGKLPALRSSGTQNAY
jgi:hypothetical protein